MNELGTIQIERFHGVEVQIRDQVRRMIATGRIQSGAKLPPTAKLARLLGAGSRTVQKALTPLVKEGLLIRRPKHGTFVRQREAKLTCVGLYCREDYWTDPEAGFLRALHAALKEELSRQGMATTTWVDHRSKAERASTWTELCRAAEHREIQGLISGGMTSELLRWMNRLPIPVAFLGLAVSPNAVVHDYRQLVELGLRALAAQGCRSVGLILPLPAARHAEFYGRFTNLVSDLGLAIRNEWMRVPRSEAEANRTTQERYGYEEFLRLWSLPARPDGLFVFPDATARGVILGLREKQVRVPAELKLVFHKNEAVDLLCPMPATFVVSSERETARALIQQIQKQLRGERCEPIQVGYALSPSPTEREQRQNQRKGSSYEDQSTTG